MDRVSIILENNVQKEVYSIFYLYNSKYYLIYTESQLDENGYVILHLVQVGKEIRNTPTGPVDTGNMLGVEISDPNEWKLVQESITKIVSNKKNKTDSPDIKYLSVSMLNNLKIVSKKTFRLMQSIVEEVFGISLATIDSISTPENNYTNNEQQNNNTNELISTSNNDSQISENTNLSVQENSDVIVDYRARFFEEQSKNEQLQIMIDGLNEKIENIKKIIE